MLHRALRWLPCAIPSSACLILVRATTAAASAPFAIIRSETTSSSGICIFLDNHLGYALSTQGLAALERLALETSKRVEDGGEGEEDGADDQAGRLRPDANPLYSAQHGVEPSAHVVRLDLADEGIELGGCRADSEQQRDLDENDEEGRHSVDLVSRV